MAKKTITVWLVVSEQSGEVEVSTFKPWDEGDGLKFKTVDIEYDTEECSQLQAQVKAGLEMKKGMVHLEYLKFICKSPAYSYHIQEALLARGCEFDNENIKGPRWSEARYIYVDCDKVITFGDSEAEFESIPFRMPSTTELITLLA